MNRLRRISLFLFLMPFNGIAMLTKLNKPWSGHKLIGHAHDPFDPLGSHFEKNAKKVQDLRPKAKFVEELVCSLHEKGMNIESITQTLENPEQMRKLHPLALVCKEWKSLPLKKQKKAIEDIQARKEVIERMSTLPKELFTLILIEAYDGSEKIILELLHRKISVGNIIKNFDNAELLAKKKPIALGGRPIPVQLYVYFAHDKEQLDLWSKVAEKEYIHQSDVPLFRKALSLLEGYNVGLKNFMTNSVKMYPVLSQRARLLASILLHDRDMYVIYGEMTKILVLWVSLCVNSFDWQQELNAIIDTAEKLGVDLQKPFTLDGKNFRGWWDLRGTASRLESIMLGPFFLGNLALVGFAFGSCGAIWKANSRYSYHLEQLLKQQPTLTTYLADLEKQAKEAKSKQEETQEDQPSCICQ